MFKIFINKNRNILTHFFPGHFVHLPAEAIGHPTAAETTQHAANGEYRHRHRVQLLYELLANILTITILVYILHEILNILFGRIYHTGIVTELQHTQHR